MLTRETVSHLSDMFKSQGKVLSVYLNVDSAADVWRYKLLTLKETLDTIDAVLPGQAERSQFNAARAKIEQLVEEYSSHGKGLVVFATPGKGPVWSAELRVPLKFEVKYGDLPYVAPLAALFDEYQRYCVVLVDNEKARIFLIYLGDIEERREVIDEVPKRHKQIEWDPRVERRHAAKVQQHLAHVIELVATLHREKRFNRLILGGGAEALPKFERTLPKHLASLLIGHFSVPMYASDQDVVKETMNIEERLERRKETQTVKDLVTRAAKGEKAVVGADSTFLALHRGQVFELIVPHETKVRGSICPTCGLGGSLLMKSCPICKSATNPVDDVVERAVSVATAANRIRIEVVEGEAKEKLLGVGGMGALLQYS
ncbi:MAG: hypothetical protein HYX97_01530 [Chloroflexi bacterium]|nr:hypothetical protein [Chloroflexota bacterium]